MNDQARAFKPGRYAAIDIGTVTARLLVADVDADGTLSDLQRDHDICNLGVGVDKTGVLDPAAIERVGAVVGRFVETLDGLRAADGKPIEVTANATSASRDARNSGDFVSLLANLGIELQVIPGEKEAGLSFAGASSAFPGEQVIVLDVGGGSSEVIAGQAGCTPAYAHSFNIGCRRVTERYFESDPPTADQIAAARTWITKTMRDYLGALASDGYDSSRIVAVAGTATSVVSMRDEMQVYDSTRVHGACVSRAELGALFDRLARMPLADREHVTGLEPQRAPVIVAGLLILQCILDTLGADSMTVSERDILHGIILDAASE